MARYQRPVLNFNADDVWSAACAAQRINGDYVKLVTSYATNEEILPNSLQTPAKQDNRMIMDRLLADQTEITQQDRDQAQVIRAYFKGFTFKILQGKKLSDFDNTAMAIANRDVIQNTYDIAVIASLPLLFAWCKAL